MHVADVLQAGMVGVATIVHGRRHHFGIRVGARKEQELLALVAADITEDPAIARPVIEPVRPLIVADLVRPEAHCVHHLSDGAGGDQFAGLHGRARFEMLRVAHRIDATGLGLHAHEFPELLQRRHARLVGHHVFAVPHDLHRDPGALVEDCGRQYQLDRGVIEDRPPVGNARRLRILGRERRGAVILGRVERHELGALA